MAELLKHRRTKGAANRQTLPTGTAPHLDSTSGSPPELGAARATTRIAEAARCPITRKGSPVRLQPRSVERRGQFRILEQLPLLRRAREFHERRRTRPNDHADQQLRGWPLACDEICIQIGEVAPVLMLLGPGEQSLDLRTRRGEAAPEDLAETSAP